MSKVTSHKSHDTSLKATNTTIQPLVSCVLCLVTLFFAGCQTVPKKQAGKESPEEVISALGTVTQGLTNANVSQEDLKRLAVQVQKDPQVKSAVLAVNNSFNVQDTGVKYCPTDGKRFSSRLDRCPEHKVKLLPVE